jgi:hypothetical protein
MTTTKTQEEREIEAVEKVLGEPVFVELSEPTLKARRNLLTIATIAVAFWWWDLSLASSPTVMGVQLQNFSGRAMAWCFLWAVAYLLGHFVWLAWDAFQEWRLRITGNKAAAMPYDAAKKGITDPRQLTLYGWWVALPSQLSQLKVLADETSAKLQSWQAQPTPTYDADSQAILQAIQTNTSSLAAAVHQAETILKAQRVPVSLERFDSWFLRFQSSQNWRWLLLEFGLPTLLGVLAIYASFEMLRRPTPVPNPPTLQVTITPAQVPASAPAPASSKVQSPAPAASVVPPDKATSRP